MLDRVDYILIVDFETAHPGITTMVSDLTQNFDNKRVFGKNLTEMVVDRCCEMSTTK